MPETSWESTLENIRSYPVVSMLSLLHCTGGATDEQAALVAAARMTGYKISEGEVNPSV